MKQHREQTRRVPQKGMARRLLSCFLAFLLLFFASISLWGCGENDDGEWELHPVSEGLIEKTNGVAADEGRGAVYASIEHAYLFKTNLYDVNDSIEMTYYYSFGPLFHHYYEAHLQRARQYGDITEHHVHLYLMNADITKEYALTEDKIEQHLLTANEGMYERGIYLCETVSFENAEAVETFPVEKYDVTRLHEGDCWFDIYDYSKAIVFPKELFCDNEGEVSFVITEYVKHENGQEIVTKREHIFSYKVIDNQVYLSVE